MKNSKNETNSIAMKILGYVPETKQLAIIDDAHWFFYKKDQWGYVVKLEKGITAGINLKRKLTTTFREFIDEISDDVYKHFPDMDANNKIAQKFSKIEEGAPLIEVENSTHYVYENEIWLAVLSVTKKEPDQIRVIYLSDAIWLFYSTGDKAGIIKLNSDEEGSSMVGVGIDDKLPNSFDDFVKYHSVDIYQHFPHLK